MDCVLRGGLAAPERTASGDPPFYSNPVAA